MPEPAVRTASVLVTDEELDMIASGRCILYRPRSEHWDAQLRKFTVPRPSIDGVVIPDVVHLIREIAGKTMIDRSGRELPLRVKVGSRLVREISASAVHPRTAEACWALVLGEDVECIP